MSNDQTNIKQIKSKNNYEKYPSFSQYLSNIFSYISTGNFLIQKEKNDFENINQNSLLKYSKISGSKSINLSNINSLPLNDSLNQNLDMEKTIKENLSFISGNTKYINNIQKINNKTKNIFQNNLFLFQNNNITNNIFNINKNIIDKMPNISDQNKENEILKNNFIIQELPGSNIIKEKSNKDKFNSILNSEELNKINSGNQTIYRQDYYIKQFKVQYSIWLRNILNSKLSLFLKKVKYNKKLVKFYPLNSLKFTANPKYKDNKIFLSLRIKDILIIGINGNRSSNQKKNKDNILFVENLAKANNDINDDLIEFLNLTMEESIRIFYKSEQFIKFKNSSQAKINDNKFFEEKKFSLLEENGFIFLIKNFNGNSKSEEFN
jgi:hypothetical protein